jgi:hypothetical protein
VNIAVRIRSAVVTLPGSVGEAPHLTTGVRRDLGFFAAAIAMAVAPWLRAR